MQEAGHPRDLLGPRNPGDRLRVVQFDPDLVLLQTAEFAVPRHRAVQQGSVRRSRTQTVDPNVEGRVVNCGAFGQLPDRRLRQTVNRTAALSDERLIRSHQQDRPVHLHFHHRNHRLEGVEHTLEIDRQHRLELLDRGLLESREPVNPRVGEQAVDSAFPVDHFPNGG